MTYIYHHTKYEPNPLYGLENMGSEKTLTQMWMQTPTPMPGVVQ